MSVCLCVYVCVFMCVLNVSVCLLVCYVCKKLTVYQRNIVSLLFPPPLLIGCLIYQLQYRVISLLILQLAPSLHFSPALTCTTPHTRHFCHLFKIQRWRFDDLVFRPFLLSGFLGPLHAEQSSTTNYRWCTAHIRGSQLSSDSTLLSTSQSRSKQGGEKKCVFAH